MIKFVCFSVLCLQTLHLALCPTDLQEIRAKLGHDVTLQCQDPRDKFIKLLEWIRPDLGSESYVFIFRDDRTYENYQHPSFRGRVELRDPQRKDGDVSVILKNFTINDTGKYECRVTYEDKSEFIHIINVTVTDSGGDKDGRNKDGGNEGVGDEDGNVGLAVGASVSVLLVVVGFLIYKNHKGLKKPNLIQPPPKEASDEKKMLNVPSCESLDDVSLMIEPDQNQLS